MPAPSRPLIRASEELWSLQGLAGECGKGVAFVAKGCEFGHHPFDFFCHSAYLLKESDFL